MKAQTESGPRVTPEELCAMVGVPFHIGAKTSGQQFQNFAKGWALAIMGGSRVAHWFERDGFHGGRSLCNFESPVRWLYGPGNFPRCGLCIRQMTRRIRNGTMK